MTKIPEPHFVVCIRDGTTGNDTIVGPFYSRIRAQGYRNSVTAVLASDSETIAVITPIFPAGLMRPQSRWSRQPWEIAEEVMEHS